MDFAALRTPHPFPYQGSKRKLAKKILSYFPKNVDTLIEPFCGAAAISIATANFKLSQKIHINDLNTPLMGLWKRIIDNPDALSDNYEKLWNNQHEDKKKFFLSVRDEFNITQEPDLLLFLLAKIVKGAVRYSSAGKFNQSADNRRAGMRPETMRKNLHSISSILSSKTIVSSLDFREVAFNARSNDLVYMDPPYQGTSFVRDHRYLGGLAFDEFSDALLEMNKRDISYIVSYDGKNGDRKYGEDLPKHLELEHLYVNAGRSSQSTLLGGDTQTFESLYLSPTLLAKLKSRTVTSPKPSQKEFVIA